MEARGGCLIDYQVPGGACGRVDLCILACQKRDFAMPELDFFFVFRGRQTCQGEKFGNELFASFRGFVQIFADEGDGGDGSVPQGLVKFDCIHFSDPTIWEISDRDVHPALIGGKIGGRHRPPE